MKYHLPLTIDNGHGETITFREIIREDGEDKLLLEGRVQPGCGPARHVHFKQDEHFEVVQGEMTYELCDDPAKVLSPGQGATFLRNQPHKFWNSGDKELVVSCWVKPANNVIFYLSTLYEATAGQNRPDPNPFDGAYLITRYRSEYDIIEMPAFVKKVIVPATYLVGKLTGRYRKFRDAPKAV